MKTPLCHKQTSAHVHVMSALPLKADIGTQSCDVCFVPKADISGRSCEPLDDAEIPFRRIVERLERCLIARAVMGRDRVRDTVELDDHDALLEASLVGLRGRAAREKVGAVGGEGRDGKLDVSRVRLGIRDRAIDCHLCMISGCDETFFGVRG